MENSKFELPKILICAPQHESKNYAWDMWWERVQNLTYPRSRIEIFLADNSKTKDNVKKFKDLGIKTQHIPQNKKGIIFTIKDSHEACRKYALKNDFDFIFHLETDIIPPVDVIERLLCSGKKVVGGTYDLLFGKKRTPMIQLDEKYDVNIRDYRTPDFLVAEEPQFFDGTLKQVYHLGLGCVLIHKSILERVPFRVFEGFDIHTDTWFANDCFQLQIPIFADTTIQCKHYNQTWLGKVQY
jgi:hypothetical protein